MADALDAVSPDVEARKRALLEAVASGGTAGLKAYESSQQGLQTARGQAIDAASGLANLIGGPESQGFAPQAGSVYDRRIADLGVNRDAWTQNFAARGAANKNYLDQVAAAVPLVRAQTERDLALKRMELDARNASSSADGVLGGLSRTELKDLLGGQAENLIAPGGLYAGQDKNDVARALGAFHTMSGSAAPPQISALFPRSTKPVADVKNIMTWAKTDEKTANSILSNQNYQDTRSDISARLGAGEGWETIDAALRAALLPGKERTYRALVAEWEPQFGKAGL